MPPSTDIILTQTTGMQAGLSFIISGLSNIVVKLRLFY